MEDTEKITDEDWKQWLTLFTAVTPDFCTLTDARGKLDIVGMRDCMTYLQNATRTNARSRKLNAWAMLFWFMLMVARMLGLPKEFYDEIRTWLLAQVSDKEASVVTIRVESNLVTFLRDVQTVRREHPEVQNAQVKTIIHVHSLLCENTFHCVGPTPAELASDPLVEATAGENWVALKPDDVIKAIKHHTGKTYSLHRLKKEARESPFCCVGREYFFDPLKQWPPVKTLQVEEGPSERLPLTEGDLATHMCKRANCVFVKKEWFLSCMGDDSNIDTSHDTDAQ